MKNSPVRPEGGYGNAQMWIQIKKMQREDTARIHCCLCLSEMVSKRQHEHLTFGITEDFDVFSLGRSQSLNMMGLNNYYTVFKDFLLFLKHFSIMYNKKCGSLIRNCVCVCT